MSNRYTANWHFQHPPRPEQEAILDFIVGSTRRVLATDAPTGVGKSPICVTLGVNDGGTILTTQKILQDQYIRDWPHIPLLKGANNYLCEELRLEGANEPNCETGKRRRLKCDTCPYKDAKERLKAAKCGITNYAYAMASSRSPQSALPQKKWLILDEGHHVENALISAAEVKISAAFCYNQLGLPFEMPPSSTASFTFAERVLVAAKQKKAVLEAEWEEMNRAKLSMDKVRAIADLEAVISSIEMMLSDETGEWIFTPWERDNGFSIKPLMADGLFKSLIMPLGERIYITSATLMGGGLMAKWLGIEEQDFDFFSVDSPFPVDNRRVHVANVADMAFKHYATSLPKICAAITKIINSPAFINAKGIIHTNSFKLSRDIVEGVRDRRLIAHDDTNRDEILARHLTSQAPTVLVSPSMTEGVDLKGELSRFTIFPKVPYPNIADRWTKLRADRDRKWYVWQTLKNIVQGVGRSVRSHDDFAEAYILDSQWNRFWSEARSMAPDWFKKSVD